MLEGAAVIWREVFLITNPAIRSMQDQLYKNIKKFKRKTWFNVSNLKTASGQSEFGTALMSPTGSIKKFRISLIFVNIYS